MDASRNKKKHAAPTRVCLKTTTTTKKKKSNKCIRQTQQHPQRFNTKRKENIQTTTHCKPDADSCIPVFDVQSAVHRPEPELLGERRLRHL